MLIDYSCIDCRAMLKVPRMFNSKVAHMSKVLILFLEFPSSITSSMDVNYWRTHRAEINVCHIQNSNQRSLIKFDKQVRFFAVC